MPALRALRAAFPDHRITLVTPPPLAPLAQATGAVDAVGPPPAAPDIAVNLHGRGPQSHARLLALQPRRLIAFAPPDRPSPMPRRPMERAVVWRPDEHEVHRWCRLLRESGVPADPRALDLPRPVARDAALTLIHPGAGSPARRWPPERFAAVAAHEAARGRRVVVTAGPGEAGLAGRVGGTVAQPDVMGLVDLVAGAGRVVCGDTGVAHVATAVGTPSVVLFGPTSPALWGPPPDRPWHRALWSGHCGDPHGKVPDPGLLAVTVDDVLAALDAVESAGIVAPPG